MKAKLDFKSKRTIIITAIIAVLAIGAGVGGYFYAKGNNQAGATNGVDGSQVTEQPNTDTPSNNNPENAETDANNGNGADGTTATTNEATENNANGNNGNGATDGNAGNNGNAATGNNGATGNARTNTGRTANGTGNTTDGATTPTNADDTATTTYENVIENIVVEEPWESHSVNWTPEKLNTSIPEVNVNKPQLESSKTAYVQGEEITGKPVNTAIQKGGEITYVINIKNTGDIDASKVMVYDNVPEGTELVNNEEGTIETIKNNDGKDIQRIVWEKDVKAGEEVSVSFTVKVTADSIDLIENTAKVNGKDTDKTKTPVLTSSKKAILVDEDRELEKEESVKVGQKIKYVITAENTSEVDAVTTISDIVPEGTENATEITKPGELKDGTIIWKNIPVKAGEKAEVSFVVTVSKDTIKSIKNAAKVADTDTPSVETKVANISTEKRSEASATPLKEKDTITYTLIATNKGDGEGSVLISDEIPTGTTLVGKVKEGNDEYSEEELKSGIKLIVPANGGEKKITFTVQINTFEAGDEGVTEAEDGTLTRSIKNEKAKQDGTPTNPTDDTVEKAYVKVKVSKHWEDNDTQKQRRPEKIRFVLIVDGEETNQYYDMETSNDAEYEFTKLPKYKENFEEISYAITEKEINKDDLKFYTTSSTASEPDENGNVEFVVTNTFETPNDKAEIQVEKVWNDNKNEAGKRPERITLQVNGNGKTENVTLTGNATGEKWTAEVKLPKYNDNGEEIVYTATETETGSIFYVKESENGLTVTNKFEVPNDTKPVEVEKVWNDNNNEAGKRPEKITLQVSGNGKTENVELTGEANGEKWTETVNLPKYDAKGDEITYTATETETGSIFYVKESEKDLTVTNKFEVPNDTKPVTVTKVWDYEDENITLPTSIKIEFDDGTNKTEKSLTGTGKEWTQTYDMPVYDAKGNVITYEVDEKTGADGFVKISLETEGDTTTITNAKPALSVEKQVYSYIKDGEEIKANAVTVEKVGDIVGYKIIVTNTGKVDLEDIEVKDTIEGGVFLDYTKPNEKTETIDDSLDLKVGAEPKEYIVYYEITADDLEDSGKTIDNAKTGDDKITGEAKTIINTAVATATYEDDNGKEQTVEDNDDEPIGITPISKITSTKSSDKSEAEERVIPGDTITYTITVKNDGNMIQKNVKVTDTMTIDGAERADLKISNIRCDKDITTDNGIITINELGIGETATITATYKVQDKDVSETSIRKIKNKIIVDNDNNPHEDEVETEEYKTDITVEKKSELHKKSGNTIEGKAEYGDTITYTIIAKNSGKKSGQIVIEDDLTDLGVEVKTNGETNLTDEEIADLAETMKLEKTVTVPGEDEIEITFEVTVVSKPGKNIKNTATFGPTEDDKTSDKGYDVEKKVKISTKSESISITNSNVVLVIDTSGSMNDNNRLSNAQAAAKELIDGLSFSDNDNSGSAVSVVTFSTDSVVEKEWRQDWMGMWHQVEVTKYIDNATTIGTAEKTTQTKNLKDAIDNLSADGGTRIAAGLTEAKTQIEALKAKRPDNNNVVIVLSDGNFELDDDDDTISNSGGEKLSRIEAQASALRNSSAKPTVYTIAFGSEAIDSELNVLKDSIATSSSTYFTATDSLTSLKEAFSKISKDIEENNEKKPTPSNKGLVELPNIDTSKDTITVFVNGKSSEVSLSSLTVKNGKYYLDLSNYAADADIEIEYFVTE